MAKRVFTDESLEQLVTEIKNVSSAKINISDIADDLTTSSTTKVLSAKQGVALKGEFDAHKKDGTHITPTERTNWNAHVNSAHAPSDAEKNQNAFSNIAVSGQTTVAADSATGTVTFAGSNISITTDTTNDKVTFVVADSSTSEKGIVKLTDSTSSTSTTTAATPKSVKSAYDLADNAQERADEAYNLADAKSDKGHGHISEEVTYDNTTSGLTATNVQDAIDELKSKQPTSTSDLTNDSGFITIEEVPEQEACVNYSFTLLASDWVNGSQSVTVDGLEAESDGFIQLAEGYTTAQKEAVSAAAFKITQSTDTLSFECEGTLPTVDIQMTVLFGTLVSEQTYGDMSVSIYDPQGKATDVFAYIDSVIGEINAALDEVNGEAAV